jgi:hypothetical protein
MTDTMSKTTPSTGVSAPREAVMVTGTPSGKTWGSESMNVPQSTSPAQGGVRWEDNVLTNEPMKSEPEQPAASEYGGGAINKALGSDWLTSSEGTTPLENLLKPANPSEMLPEPSASPSSTPQDLTSVPKPGENVNGLIVDHTDFIYYNDKGQLSNYPSKNIAGTRVYYKRLPYGDKRMQEMGLTIAANGLPMKLYMGLK